MNKVVGPHQKTRVIPVSRRWGSQSIIDDNYFLWESPSVRVWFQCKKRTISIGSEYTDNLADQLPQLQDDTVDMPDCLDWHYCVTEKIPSAVTILPVMPDKPVVFNLETPVLLHSGSSTSVYVELRIWLRFIDSSHSGVVIHEIPTVKPHKAWFGPSTTDGKICYWRKEKAAFSHMETSGHPHIAVCPVTVYNRSAETMKLDLIYLPVSRLSVFDCKEGLSTDRVQVTYTGESEVSSFKVSGKAPPYATSPKLLSSPREAITTVESMMTGAMNLFSRFTAGEDDDV